MSKRAKVWLFSILAIIVVVFVVFMSVNSVKQAEQEQRDIGNSCSDWDKVLPNSELECE